MEGAFVNGMYGARLVVDGGFHVHPCAVTAVAGVGGDDAAVFRGAFAHHDAGATLTVELGLADFLSCAGEEQGNQADRK